MDDLRWLRENGLEAAVKQAASQGRPVFGICGGYQMLGVKLSDPDCVEVGGEMDGMGLMPLVTVFEQQKVRTRVNGKFQKLGGIFHGLSGKEVEGYEVHMGVTTPIEQGIVSAGIEEGLTMITDYTSGTTKHDGANHQNVYGSYIHGIFDYGDIGLTILQALCSAKGTTYNPGNSDIGLSFQDYKESQYDLWADILRKALDMDQIYQILNEGIE
jgi:adenosylcobyric acid synthase